MIQEKMKTSESDSRITKVVMLVCNQIFRRILMRSFESDLYLVATSQKKTTHPSTIFLTNYFLTSFN